jgi:hypothetical protein
MDPPRDCTHAVHQVDGLWTLHWPDRNSKFHRYEDLEATPTLDQVLAEIVAEPMCIFWG